MRPRVETRNSMVFTMEKIQEKKKRVAFFLVLLFALANFSQAEDGKNTYLEDRDDDGLTNAEEQAWGTDPENDDSDGDGYRDGTEVASGFDPLKPAPGDRLISPSATTIGETDKTVSGSRNLTEEFLERLQATKKAEMDVLQNLSGDPEVFEEQKTSLSGKTLTEADIQVLAEQVTNQAEEEGSLKMIPLEELKILPKVSEKSEKKRKEVEKKQIEEYMAVTGFHLGTGMPFDAENETDFNLKISEYIEGISSDISQGDKEETSRLKSKLSKTVDEMKRTETPFVLREVHQRGVSLLSYMLKQNETVVFEKNDPLGMALVAGRIQSTMAELERVKEDTAEILKNYDIIIDKDGAIQKEDQKSAEEEDSDEKD